MVTLIMSQRIKILHFFDLQSYINYESIRHSLTSFYFLIFPIIIDIKLV